MYNVFMQKYFFVFLAGITLTLLVLLGLTKLNNNKINKQPAAITEQFTCKTDSDCQSTCSQGCVNREWMKGKADCFMKTNIICTCFDGFCMDKGLEPERPPTVIYSGCYVQGCHGLDIRCGTSKVQACDEMYKLGDGCRQFAKCETIDKKCEPVLDRKFNECKTCVQSCESKYENNPTVASECESSCYR